MLPRVIMPVVVNVDSLHVPIWSLKARCVQWRRRSLHYAMHHYIPAVQFTASFFAMS